MIIIKKTKLFFNLYFMESYEDLINPLREGIDDIDSKLLELFSKRVYFVEKVWVLKKDFNKDSLDSKRWDELLEKKVKIWENLWLEKDFIEDIWNRIHKDSLKRENIKKSS